MNLRHVLDTAQGRFYAARAVYFTAIDACAACYTDEAWQRLGDAEAAYRAARNAMDRADSDYWHSAAG